MGSNAGLDKTGFFEGIGVDQKHAAGLHVGYKKNLAVGRNPNVLGHAAFGKRDIANNLALYEIDLRQFTLEFAGEDREAAIDGEIGVINPGAARNCQRTLEFHGLRIAEIESL